MRTAVVKRGGCGSTGCECYCQPGQARVQRTKCVDERSASETARVCRGDGAAP
ncbi:hypothetical protein B0H12DRAFT_309073 [Mycena haematopus]|nr:hypothetical protein B0H12DRAFT_309073 [Mycena haematopus]